MSFEEYLAKLGSANVSDVKKLILKTLWRSDNGFPGEWVRSSKLLEVTGQKYFDRRARELRDQVGCDIESKYMNGEHCWRINSDSLAQANPRYYLTETEKLQLFKAVKYCCVICGKSVAAGVRGLQADHKIPLNRGGSNGSGNWQALCNECNVSKRRACQGCDVDCNTCSWAFPDSLGVAVTVRFPIDIMEKIKLQTSDAPTWIKTSVIKLLS